MVSKIFVRLKRVRYQASSTTLYFAENDFNQYENGLLSQTDYEIKVVNVLEFLLSQCEMRPILDFRIRFFSKELLKVAGSIEDPCD